MHPTNEGISCAPRPRLHSHSCSLAPDLCFFEITVLPVSPSLGLVYEELTANRVIGGWHDKYQKFKPEKWESTWTERTRSVVIVGGATSIIVIGPAFLGVGARGREER
jgi:hypothetical protein